MSIKVDVTNYSNIFMPNLICDAYIDSGDQTFKIRNIEYKEVPLYIAIEEIEELLNLMKQSLKKDT